MLSRLEVSPFCVLFFWFFVAHGFRFGCRGCRGGNPSWDSAGAQPCGARRAERLGRSGGRGPGRRRNPAGWRRGPGGITFWVTSPPGMLGPRFPLRAQGRWGNGARRGFLPRLLGRGTRGDLFPLQLLLPVKNLQASVFLFAHPHLTLRRRVMLALAFHLIAAVVML